MKTGLLLLLTLISIVTSQTPSRPQFEVATLKAVVPAPPGQPININLGSVRNGRVTLGNVTLTDCIKFAYSVASDAQIFGPEWIRSGETRFDIVGQAPPDTPQDQLPQMVQTLLAERLKLSLHQEKKELPFLALVVGRNGAKLAPAKEQPAAPKLGAGRISHDRMAMPVLAMLLARFERQTVIDLTGLQGPFAVELQWIPDNIRRLAPPDGGQIQINGQSFDPNGPSLYTAIQEQLGLRLDARKGPVDVIVVDTAERIPTEN